MANTDQASITVLNDGETPKKVKIELYGEEIIEKKVRPCGTCGRVYLPPNWVDSMIKIVRID